MHLSTLPQLNAGPNPSRWPIQSTPRNPAAWLTTVARNRALDVLRKEGRMNRFGEGQTERLVAPEVRPGARIERVSDG